jgi:hypothetical protein
VRHKQVVEPLGRDRRALLAEHEEAELLKVDRPGSVKVDRVDHLLHLGLRRSLAELAEHQSELHQVHVSAAIAVKGVEGLPPGEEFVLLDEVRVAVFWQLLLCERKGDRESRQVIHARSVQRAASPLTPRGGGLGAAALPRRDIVCEEKQEEQTLSLVHPFSSNSSVVLLGKTTATSWVDVSQSSCVALWRKMHTRASSHECHWRE